MIRFRKPWLLPLAALLTAFSAGARSTAQPSAGARPRILVAPWLVVDRTTNQEFTRSGSAAGSTALEARRLGDSAYAALDRALHKQDETDLVPRREWEPFWAPTAAAVQVAGSCPICASSGQLLRYRRTDIQKLARAVNADYVWLGAVAVPLTSSAGTPESDECCREALALEKRVILARSTAVLVRASDGETVWERDARWPDTRDRKKLPVRYGMPDQPRTESGHEMRPRNNEKPLLSPYGERERAVDATARELADAFHREFPRIFR